MIRPPPRSTRTDTLFPYTTLFRSQSVFANPVAVPVHLACPEEARITEHPVEFVGERGGWNAWDRCFVEQQVARPCVAERRCLGERPSVALVVRRQFSRSATACQDHAKIDINLGKRGNALCNNAFDLPSLFAEQ